MLRAGIVSAVCCVVLATAALAQVDVTASGGTPSGAYPTLQAAFDAINAGVHTGVIGIGISGSTTETASAVLHASGGSSAYTQITIEPTGGAARTISGTIAGPLVDLNGADAVTIDGVNAGGNALSLINLSPAGGAGSGTGPSTVRFTNDATADTLRNLTLGGACGATPSAQSGVVYFGSASMSGNDSLAITGCDIGPAGSSLPVNAIYALGNATSPALNNSTIEISGNRIHDFFNPTGGSTGVTVLSGNADWSIEANDFYQTAARAQVGGSGVTHYGIYVTNNLAGAGDFAITDNRIGGSAPGAAGSPWTVSGPYRASFTGIHLSMAGSGGSVQGNTITNCAWSTDGDWRGILIARGAVAVGTVSGNTIGAASGTGAILLTSGSSGRSAIGIDATGLSGVVTLSNNVIGSITTAGTTAGISTSITGIQLAGTIVSVDHNTIGSPATPNSLHASNPSTSILAQAVTGILVGSAGGITIADNLVANLRNATAGTAAAGQVRGIVTTLGACTVVRNTVHDLYGAAPINAAGSEAAVIGIAQASSVGDTEISGNVVHSLANAAATTIVNVVGIFYTGSASGSHRIDGNIVHSLSLASTNPGSALIGIQATGGRATYQNNMVRLGLDAGGASITTGYTIVGIVKGTTLDNRFYHNSVWIGGTGVGPSTSSTCAFRCVATGTEDVRDNIFVNLRENATTGGKHFAYVLDAPATIASDGNIYRVAGGNSNLASLNGGVTSIGDLQALRGAPLYGQDANSAVGDPRFLAPADPGATMSLRLQDPTAGEAAGIAIPSVTEDQEGESRDALTPTDIGADAGLYTMTADTDIFTPHIDYTPLADTASRDDRTLIATLTDVAPIGGGVPSTEPFLPRVWYRKSTDAAWTFSQPGTLQNGDGREGVWSFTILAADLVPGPGDEIQYYIVAQDQATTPNLWYNPVGASDPVHADVLTQLVPPSAPHHYEITPSFAGTYYVPNDPGGPPDRVYASLTRAGGFFAALGGLPVSGDVTLIVNGDVLDEDGTHALHAWEEAGGGGYTLTIRPDGPTARVLAGTAAAGGAPLIAVSGAPRVVIDGRCEGDGAYLTLRHTNPTAASTGATVRFDGPAAHGVLRNCVVENNGSSTTGGAVLIGAVGTDPDLQILANEIRDATAGSAGAPAHGVYVDAPGSRGITIAENRIHNWTRAGVMLTAAGDRAIVQGNSFYDDSPTAPATAQTAVFVGGAAGGHVIAGNAIGGRAPLCGGAAWTNTGDVAFVGIELAATGADTTSSVAGNVVRNIRMTGTGTASFAGIRAGGPAGPVDITGNAIGDEAGASVIESAGDGTITAIHVAAGAANAASVTENTIAHLVATGVGAGATLKGIDFESGVGTVTGNAIHDLSSASSSTGETANGAVIGIAIRPGNLPDTDTDNVVAGNILRALRSVPAEAAATVTVGIFAGDGNAYAHGRAERNQIYDLTNASTSPAASIRGIAQGSTAASWTLENNQIAITNAPGTNAVQLAGIQQDGAGACVFNTVYLGGAQETGAADSYAYGRVAADSVTLRDNLLYNERANLAPATGDHAAIANLAPVWDGWSSDYHALLAADSSRVGRFGAGYLDFAGWRAASGSDASSLSEPTGTISAASLFADAAAGDLDIRSTVEYEIPPIVSNAGVAVAAVATDFGGSDARGAVPDIGADEIAVNRTLSAPGDLPPASANYPGRYDDVTVSGAGAPSLTGAIVIFGALALEGGNVATHAYTLTIRPGGSVARTSGHVVGALRKTVAGGSGVDCSFEVGTGVDYAPITLHFDTVETAGYLTATTVSGDHPELPGSPLDSAQSVNRYWRVESGGVGFGSVELTLHFAPEDVDSGAVADAFWVGQYDAPDWALPAIGARTATSIIAAGLTAFGDFAVAERPGFTITATAGAGGTIDPSGWVPVEYGGSRLFAIEPDAGYRILDVLVDSTSVGPVSSYEFTNVTADHTIDASFATFGNEQGVAESLLGGREVLGVSPNPAFQGRARVLFRLPLGVRADIRIYDLSGRLLRRLATGMAGRGSIQDLVWDGRDDRCDPVADGVYLVRITAESKAPVTKRLTLLR